jgi:hypothetical protein
MLLEDLIPMHSTQYQKENMPFQVFYLPLLALNITTDFESKFVLKLKLFGFVYEKNSL